MSEPISEVQFFDLTEFGFPGYRVGSDGTVWLTGTASLFQVQPLNFLKTGAAGGQCDKRKSSSGHTAGMNVALGDGSVRFLAPTVSPLTWWHATTPNGNDTLGDDW